MSERKVLNKYFPPDFDPSQLQRTRGPKSSGPKVQTIRLMAPFSMKCTACGEYIYKGRKFNARKESPHGEHYLNIQIYRFYIRCTRCSAEITFKTDPKNNDYICEHGARRNFEPWREQDVDESVEERLDRLEQEEANETEDRDAMHDIEAKAYNGKLEEQVSDALDAIRLRNAKRERSEKTKPPIDGQVVNQEQGSNQEQDNIDEAIAKNAFENKRKFSEDKIQSSTPTPHKELDSDLWKVTKKSRKNPRSSLLPGLVRKV